MNLEKPKNKAKKIWNKTKDFLNNHKESIISTVSTGILLTIIYKIKCEKIENKYIAEKKIDSATINQLENKINEMAKTDAEKSSLIKTLAGAGTQAGSSRCAKQLRRIA